MTAVDPGLGFWLHYVEHSGGLVEPADGGALAVLPSGLQVQFGLPEEVSVTADPDVAREDGALLLSAGHPSLDAAADTVLNRGDTGRAALAWPRERLPDPADLLDKARRAVPVDHGRIDLRGGLSRAYLPVIRAGALVEYTVAGDDRFQERTECWVDASSRRELSASLRDRLTGAPQSSIGSEPQLPANLPAAVDAAHQFVSQRAGDRLKSLDQQGQGARDAEIRRTQAYYAEALASIDRRRANTAPERLTILDARVEATRAERSRRLDEIHERHRAVHTITPFRLHLVLVPTVVLPVDVLRGHRRYPQQLSWIWPAGVFAEIPCPSCGAAQPLVAGKERLGCQGCLPRSTPTATPASGRHAQPSIAASTTRPADPPRTPRPAACAAPVTRAPAGRTPDRQVATPRPTIDTEPARLQKMGERVCFSFWQAVAAEDRKLKKMLLPDSPAAALRRLFGADGPTIGIGIPSGEKLTSVAGGIAELPGMVTELRGQARIVSAGEVRTDRHTYPFALVWRVVDGTAIVDEVMPFAMGQPNLHPRFWGRSPGLDSLSPLPAPVLDLDPVATQLWEVELATGGLAFVARALAGWWRIGAPTGLGGHSASTLAAALARLISWRSGLRLASADLAVQHAVALDDVKRAERELQRELKLSADQVW